MLLLFVRARNSTFESRDDGAEYDAPETALAAGMQSAMDIIADEFSRVQRSTAVEITIEQWDGTPVLRSVVAMCISPLLITSHSHRPGSFADDGNS